MNVILSKQQQQQRPFVLTQFVLVYLSYYSFSSSSLSSFNGVMAFSSIITSSTRTTAMKRMRIPTTPISATTTTTTARTTTIPVSLRRTTTTAIWNTNNSYSQQERQQQRNTYSTTSFQRMVGKKYSPSSVTQLLAQLQEETDPGVVEGTNLRIVKYPHPSLRTPNVDVTPEELADGSIVQLAKEMFLVMYAAQGIGLAAPQVGVNKRVMVYNESGDPKKWLNEVVLINPRIIERSETTDIEIEGCLSFPDMDGKVERNKWIKVEAVNAKGKKIKKKYTGWEARIFQHEYDHLDGIVYVDRVTDVQDKEKIQPRLQELIAEFGPGGSL